MTTSQPRTKFYAVTDITVKTGLSTIEVEPFVVEAESLERAEYAAGDVLVERFPLCGIRHTEKRISKAKATEMRRNA